jgi:hypothetical protein
MCRRRLRQIDLSIQSMTDTPAKSVWRDRVTCGGRQVGHTLGGVTNRFRFLVFLSFFCIGAGTPRRGRSKRDRGFARRQVDGRQAQSQQEERRGPPRAYNSSPLPPNPYGVLEEISGRPMLTLPPPFSFSPTAHTHTQFFWISVFWPMQASPGFAVWRACTQGEARRPREDDEDEGTGQWPARFFL